MGTRCTYMTQNGLGVINAIPRGIYNGVVEVTVNVCHVYIRTGYEEVVVVEDDLVAMMSGGVLDVELFLISRNTLGNGKNHELKISKENVKRW